MPLKNCAPFIDCFAEASNMQVDNATDLDVAMSTNNLIKYSNNYAEILVSLWKYHKNNPNDNITDSELFKFKAIITERTAVNGNIKNVEIAVS